MTKQELLQQTKGYFSVNRDVSKLLPNKTMTRRVIKNYDQNIIKAIWENITVTNSKTEQNFIKKYSKYKIGDVLWLREPVKIAEHDGEFGSWIKYLSDNTKKYICISDKYANKKWFLKCQSIPNGCLKEMARYFIKITDVKVERLQDIKPKDIYKEGYLFAKTEHSLKEININYNKAYKWFINLWNSTAPKDYKWEDNPFVFVYEFEYINYKG